MFFKNCMMYMITCPADEVVKVLRAKIEDNTFTPCGPLEAVSTGFIPPHHKDDGLVHELAGVFMFRLKHQVKQIPPSAVNEMLKEKVEEIEEAKDRKVYRKERLSLKDEIIMDLLPTAIPVSKTVMAYLDTRLNMILVDTGSTVMAEMVLCHVRECVGGLPVMIPEVNNSPDVTMTRWLHEARNDFFTPRHGCKLYNHDGGTITIKGEDLSSEGVEGLLNEGKVVECLDVGWEDNQVTFTLHAPHIFKGIHFSEDLIRDFELDSGDEEWEGLAIFDADLALMAGTFQKMIPQVGLAFGKWLEQNFLPLEGGPTT